MLFFIPRRIRTRLVGKHVTLLTLIDLWVSFLLVVFIAGTVLGYAEKIAFKDALWQVWQTVTTVGYGDGPAKTDIGRCVTVIYSVAGIVLFGKLISVHSDYREEQRHSRRYGTMKNPDTNGFVILRYPGESNLLTLISELRKTEPDVPICLVDPTIDELPPSTQYLNKVHFVRGSLLSKATFEHSGMVQAKQIIVFPDASQGSEADATTRTIIELVEQVTEHKIPIIFVLADTKNLWMFDSCRAKAIHSNVEVLLIAQECEDPYSADAVQGMLSCLAGANPKTVAVSSVLHGLLWGEVASRFPHTCHDLGIRARPLALVRDGKPNHLPLFDTAIEPGDQIILLATGEMSWPVLENALAATQK
jgi:hypothetical protein